MRLNLFCRPLALLLALALNVCVACAESSADGDFDRAALIQRAIDNHVNSYAPYSDYNVSAAVLMDSGEVYLGVNVENASYPAGVCAEHNAIAHAVACGERRIIAIAIVGGPH